jgi:hypothetical protein
MFATIILTVILIMGPGQPDVSQEREMSSARECADAVAAWIEQDARSVGAIALDAGCTSTPKPSRDG